MVYLEIAIIVFLTLMNGFLAMAELAVVSSRRSRLEHLAEQGSRGARAALALANEPSRFLSTVQIGITLVGIVAGAYSGATLGQRLGAWLNSFQVIDPYGSVVGIGVTVVLITYLSLIVGELVPKRIALAQPERIASIAAGPLRGFAVIFAPAVWVLHVSTEGILRILGLSGAKETNITEEEIKSLIAEGTRSGVFEQQEKEMIDGVLRLADRPVNVIMTPRSEIVWLDVKAGREAIQKTLETRRYSHILICEESVDNPVGFIHTKDLLPLAFKGDSIDLASLVKAPIYLLGHTRVLNLLKQLKEMGTHVAVVIDEYGATEGIVTLTDVIEAVAGDLPEAGDKSGPEISRHDDLSWLVDGSVPTDEVERETGIDIGGRIQTLAGFILDRLGKIPTRGEGFVHGQARFEVDNMDGNRIDRVLIIVNKDDLSD